MLESTGARVQRALVGLAVLGVLLGIPLAIVGWAMAEGNPRAFYAVLYWFAPSQYVMPVAGVKPEALISTFGDPRGGGRSHEGADIFAPVGTPVVSATRGVVSKVGTNTLGGNCVWIAGEGHALYYYAHLKDWAPGLHAGQVVHGGDLLGFVGNSGDARYTASHLHFEVRPLSVWGLSPEDPVPFLANARVIEAPPLAPPPPAAKKKHAGAPHKH